MTASGSTPEQQAAQDKQKKDAEELLAAARGVLEARTALATARAELTKLAGDEPLPEEKERPEDHWPNYAEYNKTVRAWFVSFGIGALALFLVNPALLDALKKSDVGSCVVILFLGGCGLQVFVALLNKLISWHMYCGEGDEEFQKRRLYKLCNFLNSFWVDMVADAVTFAAFGYAVYLLFQLNLSEVGPTLSPSMPK